MINATLEESDALCRTYLSAFVQRAFDEYAPGETYEHNWHIDALCDYLEAVYRGEMPRLIVNMPPRALKSFIVSICFPAWVLGKAPYSKILVASHTMRPLAAKLSNDFRRILDSAWYQRVFPKTVVSKSTEFETYTTANGHRLAFGSNSPTGMGGDYIILDDPNKPDEAGSPAMRNSVNDWVDTTALNRFNDLRTGRAVVVQQRVHEDDVTGHLLTKGGWELLKLPAESNGRTIVQIGKRVYKQPHEKLLFPARLSQEILDRQRNDLGEYGYTGQYLQEPAPLGGGVLRVDWVRYYDTISPSGMNVYILVDPAGIETPDRTKREKKSDWTAMIVVGLANDNNYYVLDIIRDKLGPSDRIDKLFALHRKWNAKCGKPPRVGYEAYGLQSDLHYIEKKQAADNYRFDIRKLGGQMSKVDRIMRMEPDLSGGRWWWPKNLFYTNSMGQNIELVRDILDGEMQTFPFAKHDDCLDAMARIYETDLGALFPRLKKTGDADSYSKAATQQGWMDY